MFTFLVILEILFIVTLIVAVFLFLRKKKPSGGQAVRFDYVNSYYNNLIKNTAKTFDEKERGSKKKSKKSKKEKNKKKSDKPMNRIFILTFKGDVVASCVDEFREEISAIILSAQKGDEAVIRLDSPGGTVNGYGLAASQIDRLRNAGLKVTILVDKMAASGGYMMACVGDQIIASPFAYIGSIGVVAEFPNFSRLLKRVGIDWQTHTAGESKRDVGPFGAIKADAVKRHKKKLKEIHVLFKNHIKKYRKKVNINKIATGEYWTAQEALSLKLVDDIQTSDDYILTKIPTSHIYKVTMPKKVDVPKKLALTLVNVLDEKFQEILMRNYLK